LREGCEENRSSLKCPCKAMWFWLRLTALVLISVSPFCRAFPPCSEGYLALLYYHGSKITSVPSDFRIIVTFSLS